MLTPQRRLFLLTALTSGLLLLGATGCGSSGSAAMTSAKDALDNQNYQKALQSVEKEIRTDSTNAEAYRLKGNILFQQAQNTQDPERHAEMLANMIDAYDRAIELDPGLQGQIDARLLQSYAQEFRQGANAYNRADSLGDPEMYREAAAYFEGASQIRPDSVRAMNLAANAYLNAGDYEAAVGPLERAVESGNASSGVYNTLGQLYLQQQRPDEAITLLEEGTEEYPDNADLRSQLLNAYVRTGDTERAMNAYEEAIQTNPQNATYRANYGSMLLQSKQYDEAIEQLKQALEIDPGNVNAQYNLGVAYRNKAVAANDRIRELDQKRSDEGDELSDQERQQIDNQINDLADQRTELFRQSIEPLQEARQALQQGSSKTNLSEEQICRPLFTAYMQTNQQDEAKQVEACANFQDSQQGNGQ